MKVYLNSTSKASMLLKNITRNLIKSPSPSANVKEISQTTKVLVISHACVIDVNQQLYLELRELPDIRLMLLIPDRWKNEFNHKIFKSKILSELSKEIITLPIAIPGNNSLHFYFRLPVKKILEFRPDIIFLDEEPWSIVSFQTAILKTILGCKLVFYTKQNLFRKYPPPFNWFYSLNFKLSAASASVASEVNNVLRKKGYKNPIYYLPHSVDEAAFYPESKPSKLRDKLILTQTCVIGYVGRLIEAKGIQVLVKAAAILAQEKNLPSWKVLLVGDGEYRQTLEQLIAKLGLLEHFIFSGSVPHNQISQYMNCLDIFVLPSLTTTNWKEQFGRVIIEALACGVPVIGSDSGEIPHLILSTGGGLVSHEGDEFELAQHLKTLLVDDSKRKEFAEKGLASVKANFTNEGVARRLAEILRTEVSSA